MKSHLKVWFHPEDEPETIEPISKALKGLWAGASSNPTYYRGGTVSYFVSFADYHKSPPPKKAHRPKK